MTALKYDKLLHYIKLYIIHNRLHYTPVGALKKINKLKNHAVSNSLVAAFSVNLFLRIVS